MQKSHVCISVKNLKENNGKLDPIITKFEYISILCLFVSFRKKKEKNVNLSEMSNWSKTQDNSHSNSHSCLKIKTNCKLNSHSPAFKKN